MKKGSASVKKPRGKGCRFKKGFDPNRHVHGSKNVEAVQYPIEAVNELARLLPAKEWAKIIVEGVRRNRPGYKELYAKYVMGEPAQKLEHSGEIKTNDPLVVKVVFVKDGEPGNGNGGNGKPKAQ